MSRNHPTIWEDGKPHRSLLRPVAYQTGEDAKRLGKAYPDPEYCHKEVWSSDGWGSHQCGNRAKITEEVKDKDHHTGKTYKVPVCRIHSREYLLAKEAAQDDRYNKGWAFRQAKWDADGKRRELVSVLVRLTPAQVASLPEKVRKALSEYQDALMDLEGLSVEHEEEARGGDALDKIREAPG